MTIGLSLMRSSDRAQLTSFLLPQTPLPVYLSHPTPTLVQLQLGLLTEVRCSCSCMIRSPCLPAYQKLPPWSVHTMGLWYGPLSLATAKTGPYMMHDFFRPSRTPFSFRSKTPLPP